MFSGRNPPRLALGHELLPVVRAGEFLDLKVVSFGALKEEGFEADFGILFDGCEVTDTLLIGGAKAGYPRVPGFNIVYVETYEDSSS